MAIHNVYKPIGKSPLQMIDALKRTHPDLAQEPMTYAGRLDPMADGVLLILSGEDRHEKDAYLTLPKTYDARVLFGVASDSYDVLGIPQLGSHVDQNRAEQAVQALPGSHTLPFPAYASYKVQGKPLHWWASEKKLNEIDIPVKEMRVLQIDKIKTDPFSHRGLMKDLTERIESVEGNFRQGQILEAWKAISPQETWITVRATLTVSSGTYIRSLAHMLGQELACSALLYSLTRRSVGNNELDDAQRLM